MKSPDLRTRDEEMADEKIDLVKSNNYFFISLTYLGCGCGTMAWLGAVILMISIAVMIYSVFAAVHIDQQLNDILLKWQGIPVP
jgi:hypothetical protein